MNKFELRRLIISEILKQDISKLRDRALSKAGNRAEHDEIVTIHEMVKAGLSDYELAWRQELERSREGDSQ